MSSKNMKKGELREAVGASKSTFAKLGKNENLTTAVLVKICNALDCDISEIMEIIPEETEVKKEEVAIHG